MKKLFILLITVGTFSIAGAQNFIPKELFIPKLDLTQKNIPGVIYQGYASANAFKDPVFNYRLSNQELKWTKEDQIRAELFGANTYKMPILVFPSISKLNMKIWIPDSTVRYSLNIKKTSSDSQGKKFKFYEGQLKN